MEELILIALSIFVLIAWSYMMYNAGYSNGMIAAKRFFYTEMYQQWRAVYEDHENPRQPARDQSQRADRSTGSRTDSEDG